MSQAIVIPISAVRRLLIVLVLVIALAAGVVFVRSLLVRPGVAALFPPSAGAVIDRGSYQAVFLTNGSTFFGKLDPEGDDWFLLSDVFYLTTSDQAGPQLIKRGNEPQGPREPMIIPRDQVLFIENMRDESDVVNLIRRFKSGQLPAATPPPPTPAATPRPSATR